MTSFYEQYAAWEKTVLADLEQTAKRILENTGERLLKYSPVGNPYTWNPPYWPPGYVPGQFKGSWKHSLGSPSDDTQATIDGSGGSSRSAFSAGIAATPFGAHYFTNNLDYAMALEEGWSPQAPAPLGIGYKTALDFPGIVNEVMKE